MVPGTSTCPPGWSREYSGWIMSSSSGSVSPDSSTVSVNHICMDGDPTTMPGNTETRTIRLAHVLFSGCPSRTLSSCNRYNRLQRLPCVVCSRWVPIINYNRDWIWWIRHVDIIPTILLFAGFSTNSYTPYTWWVRERERGREFKFKLIIIKEAKPHELHVCISYVCLGMHTDDILEADYHFWGGS